MTPLQIEAIYIYPVKSCGGARLSESLIIETGLELDRAWMVIDAAGDFVSQRELPRMALVMPEVKQFEIVLRAPGMLALHVPTEAAEAPISATVWSDTCSAFDMGATAAQWFSDFLGVKGLRLVRFDPEHVRLADSAWTGGVAARSAFSDGFPFLLASQASLDDVSKRLVAGGHGAIGMERFRPNIVVSGLDAFGEDYLDEIVFDADDGQTITLKLVKPCPRCPIPNVNPATGVSSPEVMDVLTGYRSNPRVNGAVTFGMNAIALHGIDQALRNDPVLRVGQRGVASVRTGLANPEGAENAEKGTGKRR